MFHPLENVGLGNLFFQNSQKCLLIIIIYFLQPPRARLCLLSHGPGVPWERAAAAVTWWGSVQCTCSPILECWHVWSNGWGQCLQFVVGSLPVVQGGQE